MSDIIRLCHPFNFKLYFEYERNKFTGFFSSFGTDLLNSIERASNITFQVRSEDDGAGTPINGSTGAYSGCIGLLQANQTDAMLYLTDYPHSATNITQGIVMMDSAFDMITLYDHNIDRGVESIQAEQLFNSFRPSVWALCVVTMFICISALFVKEIFKSWHRDMVSLPARPRYMQAPYEVITHMTKYGQLSNSSGAFRKTLFLVLSFFSTLVIFYLCSYINTDLVVATPPKTLRSYQQLLDNECGICFNSGGDDYQSFETAEVGTLERSLWDFSVSHYPKSTVLFSYGENLQSVALITSLLAQQKIALIVVSDWSPLFMKIFCDASLNKAKLDAYIGLWNSTIKGNHLPLSSRDSKAKVFQKGFISNSQSSAALKRIEVVLRQILEAGIPGRVMKLIGETEIRLIELPTKGDATFGNMQKCMAGVLFMPEGSVEKVNTDNFANFPRYAAYLVSLELLVLFVEVMVGGCFAEKSSPCRPRKIRPRIES